MVTSAVWSSMFPGLASSRTRCWCIEIFWDTTVYDFEEDLFFRFSELIITEILMPFLPRYFREKMSFDPAVDFKSFMTCSQRKGVAMI